MYTSVHICACPFIFALVSSDHVYLNPQRNAQTRHQSVDARAKTCACMAVEFQCACLRLRIWHPTNMCEHLDLYLLTLPSMYTHVHTCTHMYAHVHTCMHMYTHVCTCTHTHTELLRFVPGDILEAMTSAPHDGELCNVCLLKGCAMYACSNYDANMRLCSEFHVSNMTE